MPKGQLLQPTAFEGQHCFVIYCGVLLDLVNSINLSHRCRNGVLQLQSSGVAGGNSCCRAELHADECKCASWHLTSQVQGYSRSFR